MNSSFSAAAYKKPFYKVSFFCAHHYSKGLVLVTYFIQLAQQRSHTDICFNIDNVMGAGYQFLMQIKKVLPGLAYGNIITLSGDWRLGKYQFNNMYKE